MPSSLLAPGFALGHSSIDLHFEVFERILSLPFGTPDAIRIVIKTTVQGVDQRGSIHLEKASSRRLPMQVVFEPKGPILLVRILETQIGADSADAFRSKVLGQTPRDGARIALDLTRVAFLDSSGLGALVALLKTVRPTGELVLFGLKPSVQEILRLTHLDSAFASAPNEEAALAMFSRAATA